MPSSARRTRRARRSQTRISELETRIADTEQAIKTLEAKMSPRVLRNRTKLETDARPASIPDVEGRRPLGQWEMLQGDGRASPTKIVSSYDFVTRLSSQCAIIPIL